MGRDRSWKSISPAIIPVTGATVGKMTDLNQQGGSNPRAREGRNSKRRALPCAWRSFNPRAILADDDRHAPAELLDGCSDLVNRPLRNLTAVPGVGNRLLD